MDATCTHLWSFIKFDYQYKLLTNNNDGSKLHQNGALLKYSEKGGIS